VSPDIRTFPSLLDVVAVGRRVEACNHEAPRFERAWGLFYTTTAFNETATAFNAEHAKDAENGESQGDGNVKP
jgi:hypothetical protein